MGIFSGILIASDLDGTLLCDDHTLSGQNREAIAGFCAEGGLFTAATGRSTAGVESLKLWEFANAPAVLSNGGVIYDYGLDKALFIDELKPETKQAAADCARRFPDTGMEIHCLDDIFVINRSAAIESHLSRVRCVGKNVHGIGEAEGVWIKALFVDEPERLLPVKQYMDAAYGGQFSLVFSSPTLLELQNLGTDKAFGVGKLADILNIARENVCTVGDEDNDLSMIKAFEGFATANATDEVKAAAAHLLPSCEEHAIAKMIEFLGGRL